jgi:hypothetical protein
MTTLEVSCIVAALATVVRAVFDALRWWREGAEARMWKRVAREDDRRWRQQHP